MLKNKIVEFENSFDSKEACFEYKGQQFDAYSFVKPYVFSEIQQGKRPDSGSKSFVFQLKLLFSGFLFLFTKSKVLIFSNSLERRKVEEGVIDKIFHSIQEKLGRRAVLIETKIPSNHFSRKEYVQQRVASRSIFFLLELLIGKFIQPKVSDIFLEKLKIFMEANNLQQDPLSMIRKGLAQYRVFLLFLSIKKNVKYIFLTVHYTNIGLIMAAKKKGIIVVENQHGVINEHHYGYSYHQLPQVNVFPDFLLVNGEADKIFVQNQIVSAYMKPVLLGSYILAYYEKRAKEAENDKKTVAISLQDCETGIAAYSDFRTLAEQHPSILFYFKRRRLDRTFYSSFPSLPNNATFEEKRNIYELIAESDIHLTAYSSCALEANTLGVGNLLYNLNNKAKEYYHEKIEEGQFNRYANSTKELSELLISFPQKSVDEIKARNSANFASNYSGNLQAFFEAEINL